MNLLFKIADKLSSLINIRIALLIGKLKLKLYNIKFGNNLKLYGYPLIEAKNGSEIVIGNNVTLVSNSKYTLLGVKHPTIIRTLNESAKIIIGDDVGISGATICASKSIIIGKNTMFGANAMVADTDFHPINPINRRYNQNQDQIGKKEILIGENVFIGAEAVILKGVHIGDNSVIGAGSIVTKDIPDNVIAAGNPCIVIRKIVSD
ncbi:acyltransferase [Sporolactobacillus sp. STCC-11]|uniref:acyltransferase n=1 Tax=Sporolactobacillus caesalpiniae TaxID=3230362 RepID=UPI003393F903